MQNIAQPMHGLPYDVFKFVLQRVGKRSLREGSHSSFNAIVWLVLGCWGARFNCCLDCGKSFGEPVSCCLSDGLLHWHITVWTKTTHGAAFESAAIFRSGLNPNFGAPARMASATKDGARCP